ncbi:hypothetical protein F5X98DRAFT_368588 [Xylaria grammica]|nr:hypothetical protein F5X98DRAFT_368588 [Xylaria grammica]
MAQQQDFCPPSPKGSQWDRKFVADPAEDPTTFLTADLSLDGLTKMTKLLWLAGSKRPPYQIHSQVARGRQIIVTERMDHHLVYDNSGRMFLRPIPAFLLDRNVWDNTLACPPGCVCQGNNASVTPSKNGPREGEAQNPAGSCNMKKCREIARGFLYTYCCLVSSETDFFMANERRLLPRGSDGLRELLKNYDQNQIHPRFQRGELRLSRLNMVHRFTHLPPFKPYIQGWSNYGSLFRGNLTWMATATVFIAVVLTAMQLGLATDRLKENAAFQKASYGFTVFAIVGPIGAFGLVVLTALYNLARDLPWLLSDQVRGTSNTGTSC